MRKSWMIMQETHKHTPPVADLIRELSQFVRTVQIGAVHGSPGVFL